MPRVAVVTSHPIQYQAPWFRALARLVDLQVFFCHRQTADGQMRAGFAAPFEWDVPLLDGYAHDWLTNVSRTPGVDRFGGCDTPEIVDRLERGRFDACIVNGWYLKSYVQAIRASRALGLPVLVRGDSHLPRDRPRLKSVAKYLPYRWFLRRIDAHLYVGHANRAYLEHYGVPADRLFFVPHFVDNDRFSAAAADARASGEVSRLRTEWDAAGDAIVFLFAGKLIAKKRPADFVDALASAARRDPRIRGVVIGSGDLEAALRTRAAAAATPIHFGGFRNQRQMPAAYAAADALVLPSDGRETWGLVVNEAMACGRPAIVSDVVGCAADLIDDARCGLTFPLGDAAALADRMLAMAALVRERPAEIEDAVAAKMRVYSLDTATRATVDAVTAVMRGPRRMAAARAARADAVGTRQ